MFAAVKILLPLVVGCGSMIVLIVESAHPRFVACIFVAFAVGAIIGESVRVRRSQTVRYLARRADLAGSVAPLSTAR
jgi:hypothetical protein